MAAGANHPVGGMGLAGENSLPMDRPYPAADPDDYDDYPELARLVSLKTVCILIGVMELKCCMMNSLVFRGDLVIMVLIHK